MTIMQRKKKSRTLFFQTKLDFRSLLVVVVLMPVGAIVPAGKVFGQAPAATSDSPEELYQSGRYDELAELARFEVERGVWNEKWPRWLMRAELVRGRYDAAVETYEAAIRRYSNSLVLRMLGREALLMYGDSERAEREADQIFAILQRQSIRFASADNRVAAGRYFMVRREDARQILQMFFDPVRQAEPGHVEAAIATAELALEKGDFQVAAKTLSEIRRAEEAAGELRDPQIDFLLWRALAPSDSGRAAALAAAFSRNPRHPPTLLAMADMAIDRERYDEAERLIDQVLTINPHQPQAWAYLAVLAHLRGHDELEGLMRAAALSDWAENPEVDHLIGRKLSQNYRFAEGAAYQRRALAFDPAHPRANFQLAEDLLRLGYDDVGWELAKSVTEADPYNVVAYNLATLYDRLQTFTTLRDAGISVRMESREAEIYGGAVIELLAEARDVLCEKYRVEPAGVIRVEIFPQQQDFAIRTFGLPGGAGFLGVCFGRVITANSPASQGERPANWQSVLWHEFCHAVTLEKTKNRMPRWLSEGISVYEERQRNAASGESMTPTYRVMLLDESLTPVSRLSGAFLNPPSPTHLQFAYYQSSLVVEFLIEQYGFDSLLQVLDDLAAGLPINDALARSVGSLDKLDQQFAAHAVALAESFASAADWSREDLPARLSADEWADWNAQRPDHVWGKTRWADSLIAAGRDAEAVEVLERLVALDAVTGERGGPLEQLADAYGRLGQTDQERQTLRQLVSLSDDALPQLGRLADLAAEDGDWERLAELAGQILAIQPLTPTGHRHQAVAAEELGQPAVTVRALMALAKFDPFDPAVIDYRLAKAYAAAGDRSSATGAVLSALRQSPRYRDALKLLLELSQPDEAEE